LLGFSLNLGQACRITLAGGFLVYDAIVEVETISRFISAWVKRPIVASCEAARLKSGLAGDRTPFTISCRVCAGCRSCGHSGAVFHPVRHGTVAVAIDVLGSWWRD